MPAAMAVGIGLGRELLSFDTSFLQPGCGAAAGGNKSLRVNELKTLDPVSQCKEVSAIKKEFLLSTFLSLEFWRPYWPVG
jgi:hypothetical protein